MLGVFGPDWITAASPMTSRLAGACDARRGLSIQRSSLIMLTLGLVGLDAVLAACAVAICFCLFPPRPEAAAGHLVVFMSGMALCTSLCFLERQLYSARDVIRRSIRWRKIMFAWFQSVAAGAMLILLQSCVSDSFKILPYNISALLDEPWLPALTIAGGLIICGGRVLMMQVYARSTPFNRTVIIGEHDQIQDLMALVPCRNESDFDVIDVVEQDYWPAATEDCAERYRSVPLSLHRGLDAVERMIRHDAVDTVLVALPPAAEAQTRVIVQRLSMTPVDVYLYVGMKGIAIVEWGETEVPLLRICVQSAEDRGALAADGQAACPLTKARSG